MMVCRSSPRESLRRELNDVPHGFEVWEPLERFETLQSAQARSIELVEYTLYLVDVV